MDNLNHVHRKVGAYDKNEICLTVLKLRPFDIEGIASPIRSKSISKAAVDDDQWKRAMHLKTELWTPTRRMMSMDSDTRQQAIESIPEFAELERIVNSLLCHITWKELHKLEEEELRFYCASLDLLASICAGRNGWTQRLVRQVLPVDHILYIMEHLRGDDHGLNHVHEDFTIHRTFLLPIKTKMIEVLYYCYVDSAFLPPIPKSGKSSFLDIEQQDSMALMDWDDIFYRECSIKLFGIFSQEDCDIFNLSEDMDLNELKLYIEAFDKKCVKFGLRSPIWHELNQALQEGNIQMLRRIIGAMNASVKKELAQRNVHSLEQRAILMRVIKQFVDEEAQGLWKHKIRSATNDLFLHKDSSVVFRSTEAGAILVTQESFKQIGTDPTKDQEQETVESIARNIDYMQTMLVLIQALMLRRFFEPEKMCNPVLVVATDDPEAFASEAPRNATIYDQYFYDHPQNSSIFNFDYIQTADDQTLRVITFKDNDTLSHHSHGSGHAHHREKSKFFKRNRSRSTIVKAPVGDMSHIRSIMRSMLHIIDVAPDQVLYKKFHFQDDEKNIDDFYRKLFGYCQDEFGLLQGIMNITLFACKILGTSLDLLHSVTVEELKDLFYPLFDSMIQLKSQQDEDSATSKSTHEIEKNKDKKEFTKVEQSAESLLVAPKIGAVKKKAAQFFASRLKAKMRNMTLTEEENKQFRAKTWGELYMRVARNPDMIWNIPDLFVEDSFKSCLEVIYYNDPQLRAEVMNLLYRINSRRAELSEYIMQELLIDYKATSPMVLYLNRNKFLLCQILERFDQYFFPEEDLLSLDPILMMTASRSKTSVMKQPYKRKGKRKMKKHDEYDKVITVSELRERARHQRTRKLMLSVLQLKKLLLKYNDADHTQVGLINFCCLEEFLPEKRTMKNRSMATPLQTHEDLLETATVKPPSYDEGSVNGATGLAAKFLKIAERVKNVSDRDKRKPIFTSHDENFADILKLVANGKHQRILVEFDFHEIIISYMNRNAQHLLRGDISGNEIEEEVKEMNIFGNAEEEQESDGEETEESESDQNDGDKTLNEESENDIGSQQNVDEPNPEEKERVRQKSGDYSAVNHDLIESSEYAQGSNFELPIYQEIYRLLIIFLQNIIRDNKELTKVIDKEFMSTLVSIRNVLPESMDLLSMLIKLDSKVVQFITDAEFFELLTDIRVAAMSPVMMIVAGKIQPGRKFTSTENKVLTNINRTFVLLEHIIFSDAKLSPYRIQRFIDLLRSTVSASSSGPNAGNSLNASNNTDLLLYHRILQMGLEFEFAENGGNKFGIKFQVNYTCYKYQMETKRSTFSRLPKDILQDKPISEALYGRLKLALQRWPLLPFESTFRAHLETISFIATLSKSSLSLQKLMKSFFPHCLDVLKILMIDKVEIKLPYLKLLDGVWFERLYEHNSIVPSESLLKQKCKPYLKALFYSFCQDIRLYLFLVRDPTIDRHSLKKNDSLGVLPRQFKILEKYIKVAILPFIISTIRSNLSDSLDELPDPQEDQNLPTQDDNSIVHGKKVKRLSSQLSNVSLPGSLNFSSPVKVSENEAPFGESMKYEEANSVEQSVPPLPTADAELPRTHSQVSLDGGSVSITHKELEPKPKDFERVNQSVRSLVTEVMELLSEIIDCNSEVLLPKSQEESANIKQIFCKVVDDLSPVKPPTNQSFSSAPLSFRKMSSTTIPHLSPTNAKTLGSDIGNRSITIFKRTIKRIDAHVSSIKNTNMSSLFSWTNPSNTTQMFSREDLKKLRKHCLLEFIPEVDRFANTNGYIGLDHIVKTPCAQRVYANDKEHVIQPHLALDVSLIANSIGITKYEVITNPLNCESFRYTQKEISKIIVAYANLKYEDRFDEIINTIQQIHSNKENEFVLLYHSYKNKFDELDVDAFKDANAPDVDDEELSKKNVKAVKNSHLNEEVDGADPSFDSSEVVLKEGGCCCGPKRNNCCKPHRSGCCGSKCESSGCESTEPSWLCCARDDRALAHQRREKMHVAFAAYHFDRWTRRQGMLLNLLFQHVLYCLECFQKGYGLEKVSARSNDIIKCNLYWGMLFTKGLLRSRVGDLYELYADQTETQLAQLDIENRRLALMQDVFEELGAVNVVVQQLSVSETTLSQYLSEKDFKLLHKMAIDLGTALNENGNEHIQNATIDTIQLEYNRSLSTGKNVHFVSVIRSLFQKFSLRMTDFASVDATITSDIVRLLRFISLLCEGHNKKAQTYFGSHKIVSEIANFVADMSKILSNEFAAAMFTEEEVPGKLLPKVLDIKRGLVRWINPWPGTLPLGHSENILPLSEDANVAKSQDKESKPPVNISNGANGVGLNPMKKGKYKFLPLEKLSLLVEVVTAGLEALSEFCQGPLPEVQLIIARAGSTKEFNAFFEFFGAVQLCELYQANPSQRVAGRIFRHNIQYQMTHESLIKIPSTGAYWFGNDPMATMILLHGLSKTASSVNNDERFSIFHATASAGWAIMENQSPLKESWKDWFLFSSQSNAIMDENLAAKYATIESNKMDVSNPSEWIQEKTNYIEYWKVKDKITESYDGNYYSRISKFERKLAALESSCVKLAASLLEGASSDIEIPTIVMQHIGKENIVCNMANYWERFRKYEPVYSDGNKQDCFERKMAYSYYGLAMRLCDIQVNVPADEIVDDGNSLTDLIDRWLESSKIQVDEDIARIEVRGINDSFPVVAYFPIPSLIKRYWERGDIVELRDNILFPTQQGGRDSAEEKVKSFLRDASVLITTLRHLESLDEIIATKSKLLYFIVEVAHKFNHWSNLTFLLTMTVNILLVASVVDTSSSGPQSYRIAGGVYSQVVPPLALAHLVSTCLTVFSFSIMYGWLYLKMGWRDNPTSEFEYHGYLSSRIVHSLNKIGLLGVGNAELIGNSITINTWTITASMYYILERYDCLYYIALLTFSILGNFLSPLCFACCLMEILRLSKLMQYVTKAFTANIDQVAATILLAAIILYLFTTLAFSDDSLHNRYAFDNKGENGCSSLESCFRLHLDYGMLQPVMWTYDGHIETVQGEFYNFGFTFIMQIVIPGLVSGIIIDTFSEMRGNKQAVEEDVMNTCFICNIDREDFETSNILFSDHIKNDHNMWKYAWFMIYLDEKDHTEFDGIEQFCFELIEKHDNSTRWLPLKMARALSKMRDKYDLFTIYTKITSLQSTLEKIGIDIKGDLAQQEKNLFEALRNLNLGTGGGTPNEGSSGKSLTGKRRSSILR